MMRNQNKTSRGQGRPKKDKSDGPQDEFMVLREKVDIAKLRYIMRNYNTFFKVLELWPERHAKHLSTSPEVLNTRYIARCDPKTGI